MTEAHGETLVWDLNGNMVTSITAGLEYNWDNKLRSGSAGADSVHCRYAPDGSMVYMETTTPGQTTKHKYIVDAVGPFPVILMVLDANDNDAALKTYIHANGQVLMQHDGDIDADRYFYLHDRLGSVRQVIDTDADVVNCYTYDPWGSTIGAETNETLPNRYRFAGYRWNPQLLQYYCNARWYDPTISRFSARDPVKGEFQEPMTVHAYLYCLNEPVNRFDPDGLRHIGVNETQREISKVVAWVDAREFPEGPWEAFGPGGLKFDYKSTHFGDTFELSPGIIVPRASDFGNYVTGYTCYLLYGTKGGIGVRLGGHFYSYSQYGEPDDLDSRYWVSAGILVAQQDRGRGEPSGLVSMLDFIHAKHTLNQGAFVRAAVGIYDQDKRRYLASDPDQELKNWDYFSRVAYGALNNRPKRK